MFLMLEGRMIYTIFGIVFLESLITCFIFIIDAMHSDSIIINCEGLREYYIITQRMLIDISLKQHGNHET